MTEFVPGQLASDRSPYAHTEPCVMKISRMTIDKLRRRLHDTVSAGVAELVAYGCDADAKMVTVRVPLASLLAKS